MIRGVGRYERTIRRQRYQAHRLVKTVSAGEVSILSTDTIPSVNGAVSMVINAHASGCTPAMTSSDIPTAAAAIAATSNNKATPPRPNRIV